MAWSADQNRAERGGAMAGSERHARYTAYGPPLSESRAWRERKNDSGLTKRLFANIGGTATACGSARVSESQCVARVVVAPKL